MKPVWGLFIALVAVVAVSLLTKALRPHDIIPWRYNYMAALEEAHVADRRAFLYFSATWCGPCEDMKHTTWADTKVEAALRDYVPVKIDLDGRQDLALLYGVEGVPAYVVLDPSGNPLARWDGSMPSDVFLQTLERVPTTRPATSLLAP